MLEFADPTLLELVAFELTTKIQMTELEEIPESQLCWDKLMQSQGKRLFRRQQSNADLL